MLKPASLRAAIEAALPSVKANPDKLLVFIEEGSVQCTGAASLSFEYGYTLRVILLDYAEHADTLLIPVLAWVSTNQPELFANPDRRRDGIRFEAELLNHSAMDLDLRIALTERVIVRKTEAGGYTATHAPEPPLDPYEGRNAEPWTLEIPAP